MSTLTLTFTPGPGFKREAITATSGIEYIMAIHHYSLASRPIYRFTLPLGPLTRTQMDSLSALHAFHQGATSFFWDGGEFGRVEDYQIVDEGNGVKNKMFLPNRYVGTGSISVQTRRPSTGASSVWASGFSLIPDAGFLQFGTVVVSGDEVYAKYGCRYNVCFAPEGIRVEEIAPAVYRAEIVLIENALVGG